MSKIKDNVEIKKGRLTDTNKIDFSIQYYNPEVLRYMITDLLGYNSYDDIIDWICNEDDFKIKIDKDMLMEATCHYLSFFKYNDDILYDGDYVKHEENELSDLKSAIYELDTKTLDFYVKLTDILYEKVYDMINILNKISYKNTRNITDQLHELDINIDRKGNISKESIYSIIYFIKHYSDMLKKAVYDGNNQNSYMSYNINFHLLHPELMKYYLKSTENKDDIKNFSYKNK